MPNNYIVLLDEPTEQSIYQWACWLIVLCLTILLMWYVLMPKKRLEHFDDLRFESVPSDPDHDGSYINDLLLY